MVAVAFFLVSILSLSCLVEGEEDAAIAAMPVTAVEFDEFVLVAIFTSICAICISSIGLVIFYYAYLEDQMMQRYKNEGIEVEGDVRHSEEVRTRVSPTGPCSTEAQGELEYVAIVHYKQMDRTERYKTCSVRKQVTAMESDFLEGHLPRHVQIQVDMVDAELARNLKYAFQTPQLLELLLISEFPRSALPRQQVERSCSIQQRLPTYGLVLSIFAFTSFFVYLGIASSNKAELATLYWVSGVTLAMLFFEAFAINRFMGEWIRGTLQEKYLEGDDISNLKSMDTLSTMASDSFL
jgi:hypothetical protein